VKRYVILIAAILLQACLGGVYAWSALATPLQKVYGLTQLQTSTIFSTTVMVFTSSVLLTGRLQDRFGPRYLATAGGLLLGAGYLLGSLSHGHYGFLLATTGVVNGLGIGCGYVCAVATAVRWFPRQRGLVSGLAAAGYGAGAVALGPIIRELLASGWDVLDIFRALGIGCGAIATACGLVLTAPPQLRPASSPDGPATVTRGGTAGTVGAKPRRAPVYRDALRELSFWRLMVAFFCGSMAGFVVNPNLQRIATSWGLTDATGASAILAMAAGSTSGRILWGAFYDRIGGRRALVLVQAAVLVSVLLLLGIGGRAPGAFLVAVAVLGFCFGGNVAVYAPRLAELYGHHRLGSLYAILLLAHGSSGMLGNRVNGWLFEYTKSFRPGLGLIAALMAAGLAFWLLTEKAKGEEKGRVKCEE
jgi:OFA family oxalate/formate antiporter-like MFS transporter